LKFQAMHIFEAGNPQAWSYGQENQFNGARNCGTIRTSSADFKTANSLNTEITVTGTVSVCE